MKFDNKNKWTIKELFNKVANNYDKMNFLMSFGLQYRIKKIAVKNVLKKSGKKSLKILDLCCGTGDISLFFKQFDKNADITGVDFSEEMLKIAKSRSSDINFLQGDVTNLSELNLAKESFDICFISFGLRNLPDIDSFLNEISLYLKTGGVISILDLGKPIWYMRPYFYLHYQLLIPLMALIFNGDASPYKYFIDSAKRYPAPAVIIDKLKESGFTGTDNKNFSFGVIAQQMGIKS